MRARERKGHSQSDVNLNRLGMRKVVRAARAALAADEDLRELLSKAAVGITVERATIRFEELYEFESVLPNSVRRENRKYLAALRRVETIMPEALPATVSALAAWLL